MTGIENQQVVQPRSVEAHARRELILSLLAKAEHGLTAAELKARTPAMEGQDRSNALTVLRTLGKIRRAGNAWLAEAG